MLLRGFPFFDPTPKRRRESTNNGGGQSSASVSTAVRRVQVLFEDGLWGAAPVKMA